LFEYNLRSQYYPALAIASGWLCTGLTFWVNTYINSRKLIRKLMETTLKNGLNKLFHKDSQCSHDYHPEKY